MAEQLIILDPTEEVFGKCLEGISSGLITVMSRADFPVGELGCSPPEAVQLPR